MNTQTIFDAVPQVTKPIPAYPFGADSRSPFESNHKNMTYLELLEEAKYASFENALKGELAHSDVMRYFISKGVTQDTGIPHSMDMSLRQIVKDMVSQSTYNEITEIYEADWLYSAFVRLFTRLGVCVGNPEFQRDNEAETLRYIPTSPVITMEPYKSVPSNVKAHAEFWKWYNAVYKPMIEMYSRDIGSLRKESIVKLLFPAYMRKQESVPVQSIIKDAVGSSNRYRFNNMQLLLSMFVDKLEQLGFKLNQDKTEILLR